MSALRPRIGNGSGTDRERIRLIDCYRIFAKLTKNGQTVIRFCLLKFTYWCKLLFQKILPSQNRPKKPHLLGEFGVAEVRRTRDPFVTNAIMTGFSFGSKLCDLGVAAID